MRVRLPRASFARASRFPSAFLIQWRGPPCPSSTHVILERSEESRIFLRSGSAKRQTSDHNNWHKARCGLSRLVPSPVRGERVRDNCAARLPVAPHIQEEAFQG